MSAPKAQRHPTWRVALYYPCPSEPLPYGRLVQLQLALPSYMAVSVHRPERGWGHGQAWLWVGASRKRAVSALWAAAWAHRRTRRAWGNDQPLPSPAKVTVTRTDIEEQKWY